MIDEKLKSDLLNAKTFTCFWQIYSKKEIKLEFLLEDAEIKRKWEYLNDHRSVFGEHGDFFRK